MRSAEESLDRIASLLEDVIGERNTVKAADPKSIDGKTFRHMLQTGGYILERFLEDRVEVFYEDQDGERHLVARRAR